jgi:hypothetical protein
MLPGFRRRGRADALQGRRRAGGASPVVDPSSRWDFQVGQDRPVGPTHAVDAATGAVACGTETDGLEVLDQDWEEAFFVEKCPGCFAAVMAQSQA